MNRNKLILEFTECTAIETEFNYIGEIDSLFALNMLQSHKKATQIEVLAEAEKLADGRKYAVVFGEWDTKVLSNVPTQTRFRRTAMVYCLLEEGAAAT